MAFIPELWSTQFNDQLDKMLVFNKVVNTKFENEIARGGDTLHISEIGPITVNSYDGTDIVSQELNADDLTLKIDQKKYFSFTLNDVTKAQTDLAWMSKAMERAAYAVKNEVDSYIAGLYSGLKAFSSSTYTIGSGDSDTNAYDFVVDVSTKLSEQDVPESERFIVIPPWLHGELMKVAEYASAFKEYNVTGQIPMVAGLSIMKSNNIKTTTTTYHIISGTTQAISYAGQIEKMESFRTEKNFKDGVKGLFVYGAKVVIPAAGLHISVKKGS
jgi:hypothetical protein